MPGNDQHDPLDSWLNEQVRPLPPPPGTFSTVTGTLHSSLSRCANTRALTSVALPGVKPTSNRTGRVGKCADESWAAATPHDNDNARQRNADASFMETCRKDRQQYYPSRLG